MIIYLIKVKLRSFNHCIIYYDYIQLNTIYKTFALQERLTVGRKRNL